MSSLVSLPHTIDFERYEQMISAAHLSKDQGRVTEVNGLLIKGTLPGAGLGSLVQIFPLGSDREIQAEVVGFKDQHVPYDVPWRNARNWTRRKNRAPEILCHHSSEQ